MPGSSGREVMLGKARRTMIQYRPRARRRSSRLGGRLAHQSPDRRARADAFATIRGDAAPPPCSLSLAFAAALSPAVAKAPRRAHAALADCQLPKLAQTLQCGSLGGAREPRPPGGPQDHAVDHDPSGEHADAEARPAAHPRRRPRPGGVVDRRLRGAAVRHAPTRDVVLIDQRGTGRSSPLDCALRPDLAAALELDPAEGARVRRRARGARRRRRAIHDQRVHRRPGRRAQGDGVSADQPVGRQLWHARRAGIPAPSSWRDPHRRARRRGAAADDREPRRLADARAGDARGHRRMRAVDRVQGRASGCRGSRCPRSRASSATAARTSRWPLRAPAHGARFT